MRGKLCAQMMKEKRQNRVFITYVHRRAMEFEGVKKEELVLKEEGRAERVDLKKPFCRHPVLF